MLRLSVANFSGYEVLSNKSAMTKELKNKTIGYVHNDENVYPVIQIEVTYDTKFYKGVKVPKKAIIPVAICGMTPEGVENTLWFRENGIIAENTEAYYDYFIPVDERDITQDQLLGKDLTIISLKTMGSYPDVCEVSDEKDGNITLRFCNKIILNSVATVDCLEAILPVLYYRQERFSLLKWFDSEGGMNPVMRFSDGDEIRYFAVVNEHTQELYWKYTVHLKELSATEVEQYEEGNPYR